MHKSLLITIIVLLAAALLLSACGGQGAPPSTEAPLESPPAVTADTPAYPSPDEASVANTPAAQPDTLAYPSPVTQDSVEETSIGSPYPQPGTGGQTATGITIDSLLATLQGAGLDTQIMGDVTQAFFTVPGKRLTLGGEEIQVFEYSAAELAQAEAAKVSEDGSSVGTTMVDWISTPHFYRSENLIVIYVGENQTVLQALKSALGDPFAGG